MVIHMASWPRLLLVAAVMVVSACSAFTAQSPSPHFDPVCAFDGSACQADRPIFAVVGGPSGEQATLSARAGIPENAWMMAGVRLAPGSPVSGIEPKPTARKVHVSQDSSINGSFALSVERLAGDVVATVDLTAAEQQITLQSGTYVLRLSPGTSAATSTFVFEICAGGC